MLFRSKRVMYISAARSWLFNRILSERIDQHVWDNRLPGDVFMLDGQSACFKDDATDDLKQRLESNEIHPTAPLWGEGDGMVASDAPAPEEKLLDRTIVVKGTSVDNGGRRLIKKKKSTNLQRHLKTTYTS